MNHNVVATKLYNYLLSTIKKHIEFVHKINVFNFVAPMSTTRLLLSQR